MIVKQAFVHMFFYLLLLCFRWYQLHDEIFLGELLYSSMSFVNLSFVITCTGESPISAFTYYAWDTKIT